MQVAACIHPELWPVRASVPRISDLAPPSAIRFGLFVYDDGQAALWRLNRASPSEITCCAVSSFGDVAKDAGDVGVGVLRHHSRRRHDAVTLLAIGVH
jgi:hypothetical protein